MRQGFNSSLENLTTPKVSMVKYDSGTFNRVQLDKNILITSILNVKINVISWFQ